jgi:CxxC motif-containing protein
VKPSKCAADCKINVSAVAHDVNGDKCPHYGFSTNATGHLALLRASTTAP